jgi:hypothetical protein
MIQHSMTMNVKTGNIGACGIYMDYHLFCGRDTGLMLKSGVSSH